MVLRLFFGGNLLDGAGGAKLGAAGALRAAEALFEAHLGLHQVVQAARGPKHIVGAVRHAELAAGAVLVEVFDALGAGRRDGGFPFGGLLGKDIGKAAVRLLGHLLRPGLDTLQRSGAHGDGRAGHKGAATGRDYSLRTLAPGKLILQRVELALVYAVEAVYAAGVVYLGAVLGDFYAVGLAVEFAGLAVLALLRVNHGTEHGKAGKEAEGGTHRADAVAVGSAMAKGQVAYYQNCYYRENQGNGAGNPHFFRVEGVAAPMFGQPGQQVVAPQVDGLEEILHNATVGAVGRQSSYHNMDAGHQADYKDCPYTVTKNLHFLVILVRLLAAMRPEPGNAVLEYAQRADDRAIDPAENQRQQHQGHYYAHIECQ